MSLPFLESWNTGTLTATYRSSSTGNLRVGIVKVTLPTRLTSPTDDAIIAPGALLQQALSAEGAQSFTLTLPATNDPDIAEVGWGWTVVVELEATVTDDKYTETFHNVFIPVGGSTNLRDLYPVETTPPLRSSVDLREYVKLSGNTLTDYQGNVLVTL